jgi:hypothetical protein
MGNLGPISNGLERRRARRATWFFNHALDAYTRTLSRIEQPAGELGGDPYMEMPRRAAEALPRLRREHRKFGEAVTEIDDARDAILRRLANPKTPPTVAAAARRRFDPLEACHPTPAELAERGAEWERSLARLERWAERDPDYAAAAAAAVAERRAAATRRSGRAATSS